MVLKMKEEDVKNYVKMWPEHAKKACWLWESICQAIMSLIFINFNNF